VINKPQYTTIATHLKKVPWHLFAWVIKIGVLSMATWYLYIKLTHIDRSAVNVILNEVANHKTNWILCLIIMLMMPLNWFLEAMKWQVLARPFNQLTIRESLAGVLAGLSLAFVTPRALGDYAGKVLQLTNSKRLLALGNVFVGRIFQLSITLMFGLVSAFYLLEVPMWWNIAGFLVFLVLLLFVIQSPFGLSLIQHARLVRVWSGPLRQLSFSDYRKVFLFSLFRYVVFSFQFILALLLFQVSLPVQVLFLGVAWIFLLKSILPSFNFLSDLGIREFSALLFFSQFGVDEWSVVASSLFIWIINLLLPTFAGFPFVWRLKLFNE